MRASTAYFVGAGTIVAAIAIGLGGGIVAGNIMNPVTPKQGPDTGKLGQRAVLAAAPASAPSERIQYLTGSQTFGAMIAAQAQDEANSKAKPDAQSTQAPAPPPPQTVAIEPPKPAPASPQQVIKPTEQQASTEPASSADNAYAKARDSDVKRVASERRRTERRERWAERRHYDSRDSRGMRDPTDWDDVARNVREDSDARNVAARPRNGFPQIRLFGSDDE
jgi:hypothetical protein